MAKLKVKPMAANDLRRDGALAGLIDHYLEDSTRLYLLLIMADRCEDLDDPRRHLLRALHSMHQLAGRYDLADSVGRLSAYRQAGYYAVMDSRCWPYRHRFRHDGLTVIWQSLCIRYARLALPHIDTMLSPTAYRQRQFHGPSPMYHQSLLLDSGRRLLAFRELAATGVLGFSDPAEVARFVDQAYRDRLDDSLPYSARLANSPAIAVDNDRSRLTPFQLLAQSLSRWHGFNSNGTTVATRYTVTWCNALGQALVTDVLPGVKFSGEVWK